MTVFFADEPIEPKSIVACPECGFEFSFNHSEGWSEEGYRFVCYRCRVEQAERERDEARREVERLRAALDEAACTMEATHALLMDCTIDGRDWNRGRSATAKLYLGASVARRALAASGQERGAGHA